ncbi:MAG: DUF3459 domain-containing protein [Parvularculaceae bacterium]|nr:DUF3459 domain-containing protein [Parvularculaceae bacterium]
MANGQKTSAWDGAVIYQIYPRSYQDSTGNGVGDLPGIRSRLSYVRDLGVDAIWLSPFFRSPMKDFGYDVSDFCDVDPMFGTMQDFDNLLSDADKIGLKIIIDQVYSHSSDQHAWFKESSSSRRNEKADWYVWADANEDGSPPNNWQSIFGGPSWTWSAARGQYYLNNFLPSQPDLNMRNPVVQEQLLGVAKFWLDRGVKGFRLDALHCGIHDPNLTDNPARPFNEDDRPRPYDRQWHLYDHSQPEMLDFLERYRNLCDQYGDIFTVAEVGSDHALDVMQQYTAAGRLRTAYSFDFLWQKTLSADLVRDTVTPWLNRGEGDGHPALAFSNHDSVRAASRWDIPVSVEHRAKLFGALLYALPGNIFVYQGEELGLPHADVPFEKLQDPEAIAYWPNSLGRDGARTPVPWTADDAHAGFSTSEPWLPIDARHPALAADQQVGREESTLSFFRLLTDLRRDLDALRTGSASFTNYDANVLTLERTGGDQKIVALFNLSNDAQSVGSVDGKALLTVGDVASVGDQWTLAPWSCRWVQAD